VLRTAGKISLAVLVTCSTAWANSPESDLTPESSALAKDASAYVMPDVPDRTLAAVAHVDDKDRFSVKFGVVLLGDYTAFDQDATSIAQSGAQDDRFEVRGARLLARGHFEAWRRWNYMASYEYKGFDQSATDPWAATDLRVSTSTRFGTLSIGKTKEWFAYEMVGDAANLPHHERWLSPFFRSRNVGVTLNDTYSEQRGTWYVGAYNEWLVNGKSFADSGTDVAARVTYLPVWEQEGRRYVHVATSVRYYGAEKNLLRFRGKPASNVATNYVDTGTVAGDHAWNTGVEALWNDGPWSVLGEYARADLSTATAGHRKLDGFYVTGSWVITGEHRPYDRRAGYARRVLPQGRWGAWEVFARYGRLDLNDGTVRGGRMTGSWTGVNWWATRRWKASVGYGDIALERGGLEGDTKTVLTRLQWVY
jgi:phosphate-selective porin OprO and OprP